jgi:hypothetical protein
MHFSICQDMSETRLPTNVRIEIGDSAMTTTYFNEVVEFGGDAVAFANGTCISDDLAVHINDPDTGLPLQVLELSLGCWGSSGTELLSLFGAVEFSGYTCDSGIVRNCYGAIDWAFVASGNFAFPQQVNRFEVVFNGESLDLLTNNPTTAVATLGESTPELRKQVQTGLQFCSRTVYDVELILEATEPSGRKCTTATTLNFAVVVGEKIAEQPKDTRNPLSALQNPDLGTQNPALDFNTSPSTDPSIPALGSDKIVLPSQEEDLQSSSSCGLTAIIECKLQNGVPCANVVPPANPACHGKNQVGIATAAMTSLEFSYQNIQCSGAKNSQKNSTWMCTDTSALYEGPVKVTCWSIPDDKELVVTPGSFGPGETVTVTPMTTRTTTSPAVLPSSIMCTLYGPGDRVLQKNLIDVSGTAPLFLGDQFGALQVEACGDLTCQDLFRYEMSLTNDGTEPLLVTDVDFLFNGLESTPLTLDGYGLDPGDTAFLEVTVEVDVCRGRAYEAAIEVSAARNVPGEFCASRNSTRLQLPRVWQ